jgi:hypothetical protein
MEAKAARAEAASIVDVFLNEGKIKHADIEEHITMAMEVPEQYQKVW